MVHQRTLPNRTNISLTRRSTNVPSHVTRSNRPQLSETQASLCCGKGITIVEECTGAATEERARSGCESGSGEAGRQSGDREAGGRVQEGRRARFTDLYPFIVGTSPLHWDRSLTRIYCCRSAKKPPVVAPSIAMTGTRGDPSLMRQFHNGSGNTGSPLRRDARSVASRNRDIIEEEDVDMDGGEALMIQARPRTKRAESPQRTQTRRALSPARGYQVNGLTASATVNSQEGAKSSSSSSQKHRSKALYDRITRNIDAALDAREQNLPITATGALNRWCCCLGLTFSYL